MVPSALFPPLSTLKGLSLSFRAEVNGATLTFLFVTLLKV